MRKSAAVIVGLPIVVGKKAFEAKAAGRSVHIVFHRKVISHKSKNADAKIYYIKGV